MHIDDDIICSAISTYWCAAHSARTKDDLVYAWRAVRDRLQGMWSLANYLGSDVDNLRSIQLLGDIACAHYVTALTSEQ